MIVIFIRVCNNREKDNPAKLILPAKPPSRHTHMTCILTIWLLTLIQSPSMQLQTDW